MQAFRSNRNMNENNMGRLGERDASEKRPLSLS